MTPSIDKDIMEKADDVYEDAIARFGILVSKSSRAALVVVISRALQAVRNEERERCAKIAEAEMDSDHDEWIASDMTDASAGARHWKAGQIATAIREGDE